VPHRPDRPPGYPPCPRPGRPTPQCRLQWTLWGAQAEAAVAYLDKGSHVNVVGRVQNNRYEKDGQTVYGMDFIAEEIDYLDSQGDAQARQARRGQGGGKPPNGASAARKAVACTPGPWPASTAAWP
jgi:single-strand DNA-binding protein